jgi:hypothetical protein
MSRTHISTIGVVAVLAVAAAGSAIASSTAVPAPLLGTWGKTMSAGTWARYHVPGEPPGHFALVVGPDGITRMYYGLDPTQTRKVIFPFTTMKTGVSGGSVTFGPTTDGACPGSATYTWSASGKTLSLRLVKDDCDARRVLMTAGGAFVREGG